MSKRIDVTDQILYQRVDDVSASGTDNATVRSEPFNTLSALCNGVMVDVHSLGENKKYSLGLEHFENGRWLGSVLNTDTDIDVNHEFSANAIHEISYWGNGSSIRLRLISRAASPAAIARVYFWKTDLLSVPKNIAPGRYAMGV